MSKIVVKSGSAYEALRKTKPKAVALAAGLSEPTVTRVFRGEACHVKTAKKLCQAIGCGFADLFEIKKEVRPHG